MAEIPKEQRMNLALRHLIRVNFNQEQPVQTHLTASFDHFCTARKTIPLYMPHSSHLLQPLHISCFAPLKHYYGQKFREVAKIASMPLIKKKRIPNYLHQHGAAIAIKKAMAD